MKRCAALGLLLLLAACQPQAGSSGAGQAQEVGPEAGHLRRQIDQPPRTLDPGISVDVPAQRVIDDLFEGLVRLDAAGQLVPGVARSWEITADQLQWTFHLRADVQWSDGVALTANDFVYAWRRVVDPANASQGAQMLAPIVNALTIAAGKLPPEQLGVRAVDAHTLVVQLTAPTAWFAYLLTNNSLYPVPEHLLKAQGNAWTRAGVMVSNGAFVLTALRINGAIQLTRNPRYYDAAAVRLQQVTYFPVGDRSASVSRYLAGDLDLTDGFPLEDIGWLRAQLGEQLQLAPYLGTVMFGFNHTRSPFDSAPLRMALNLAVDRELLTSKLLKGLYLPAYSLVPGDANNPALQPEWAQWSVERRHERARQLYAQAGYSPQHPLRVDLAYPTSGPDTRRILEALSAMWQVNLGAEVRLANEEWRVHQQNRRLSVHQLFWNAWIGDYPYAQTFLDLYRDGSPQNHGHYHNDNYERLLAAATASGDAASRQRAWQEAEQQLNADAAFIPVYYYQSRHLLRPWVQGWQGNIMDRHSSRDLYIVARQNP